MRPKSYPWPVLTIAALNLMMKHEFSFVSNVLWVLTNSIVSTGSDIRQAGSKMRFLRTDEENDKKIGEVIQYNSTYVNEFVQSLLGK